VASTSLVSDRELLLVRRTELLGEYQRLDFPAGFTVMPTRETHYGTATGRYWLTGMKSVPDRENLTS
jgi:hypothetical protein